MKRTVFLLLLLLTSAASSFCCEICGCGVGNFYMGNLPRFKTSFIGIRYHYMRYRTVLAADPTQFSNDYYKTAEFWGGLNLGDKWQALAFIPYRFNRKISDDGVTAYSGLGDISLLVQYSLLHTRRVGNHNSAVEQQLWLGAGVKLPAGHYRLDLTDPNANIGDANSQAGTGSTDFLATAAYSINIARFGINASGNYKMNTVNRNDYRFGNRLSLSGAAYYKIPVKGISISPNAGLLYEHAAGNQYQQAAVDGTGGYALHLTGGIEVTLNKISIGLQMQTPIVQRFAEGQTQLRARGVLQLSLAL
jgi:hypothetical protein